MKFYPSGADLAKDMGVPLSTLEATHDQHYQAAKKTESDPDGGEWPAYPSGKSHDAASGPTGSGKKFYHNIIPGSAVAKEEFYVAIITPVIHYCMGGLEVTVDSEVVGKNGKIPGLYAAGEVAGGIHGNNRLGGNSLLDCVVYGRVAGKAACRYTFGADDKFRMCLAYSHWEKKVPVARLECQWISNRVQYKGPSTVNKRHFSKSNIPPSTDLCVHAKVAIGGVNLLPEVGLYNGARGEIVDFNYGTRMAGPNNKHEDHLPAYTVVDSRI